MMTETTAIIGLYRSGITNTERLLETSIGRADMLEDIIDKLRNRVTKKSGINRLFIGPRGIGKTHLLSLLEHSINSDTALSQQYTVIRFPEETNRILSFADLLLGIIEILAAIELDSPWQDLYQQLYLEEQDELIIDTLLPRLKHYHQQTGISLVIMLENLDTVLVQQLKNKKDIHRLRSFMMDNPHIIMIATAPVYFPALNDIKHPLYDFFDVEIIDSLSKPQTLDLIRKNLQWDQRQALLDAFHSLQPKILALHEMTGGNPRLIMKLYGLIAQDQLLDVQSYFHQLLDQITPFYQNRIKDLPPQERALLETLALMRDPLILRTPVNIAKRLRKSTQQTSTLLKRMTDAGYLSVNRHPSDKRSRLYRIKEGFFDLWLAMNESRGHRKYLPYLVEFFNRWYSDEQQREQKRRELINNMADDSPNLVKQNALEYLGYLTESSAGDERNQTKLALAVEQLQAGTAEASLSTLQELPLNREANPLLLWMHDNTKNWASGSAPEADIRQRMQTLILYWSEQRLGDLEAASRLMQQLSLDFSGSGLHKLNVALLEQQFDRVEDVKEKILLTWKMAKSLRMDGLLGNGLRVLNQGLDLARKIDDKKAEGTLLNNISQIYHAQGNYDTTLQFLMRSLDITQKIGDKAGEGTTLNNISQVHKGQGDYDTALQFLERSLEIAQATGDKAGEATTFNNISQIYDAQGDYDTALPFLKRSLDIQQEIGDKAGEGTTLNNISQIYDAQGDYDTALQFLERSLEIAQTIGDKAGVGTTLNNISSIYQAQGDYDTALPFLKRSLDIRQEIGDKAGLCFTLFNMGHIHWQNAQQDEAIAAWVTVYILAKPMQLNQVLTALDTLAEQLQLPGGLQAWEKLAQQMKS